MEKKKRKINVEREIKKIKKEVKELKKIVVWKSSYDNYIG